MEVFENCSDAIQFISRAGLMHVSVQQEIKEDIVRAFDIFWTQYPDSGQPPQAVFDAVMSGVVLFPAMMYIMVMNRGL